MTQNNMGKSSYTDPYMSFHVFARLISKSKLELKKPILFVGAGYGAGVSELLSLGANKIYFNDLDLENMECAKSFINSTLPEKKGNVHYLLGDIAQIGIVEEIPDNTLGLIYAKNVIPSLGANQLLQLIEDSHRKLDRNGLLMLVFENPFLQDQQQMVKEMELAFDISKKYNKQTIIDDVVIYRYRKDGGCSIKSYVNTHKAYRTSGFPCILHGGDVVFNALIPDEVENILIHSGFEVIESTSLIKGTFFILARKI